MIPKSEDPMLQVSFFKALLAEILKLEFFFKSKLLILFRNY